MNWKSFTPATRIQIPLGTPFINQVSLIDWLKGLNKFAQADISTLRV